MEPRECQISSCKTSLTLNENKRARPMCIAPDKIYFCWKGLIFFLFLHENICCGYSLEAPQRGVSNEDHNICFHGEIWKQAWGYPLLSGAMNMLLKRARNFNQPVLAVWSEVLQFTLTNIQTMWNRQKWTVVWYSCTDAQTDVNLRYSHMSHGWLCCGPAQTLIKVYERHEL